jgi:hypothetical protein
MGMTLAAVSHDSNFFSLEMSQIRIFVIINCRHFSPGFIIDLLF